MIWTDAEKADAHDIANYLIREQKRKLRLKGKDYLIELLPDKILDYEYLFDDFEVIFEERVANLECVENLCSDEAERLATEPESLQRIIDSVLCN